MGATSRYGCRVLFVCTANICRSPMAECILDALAQDRGFEVRTSSAGTAALVGEPMDPSARRVLEEVGIYPNGHRARQVDAGMLEASDLVLAMTPEHARALLRLSPEAADRVYTLPGYASGGPDREGIPDPHGQSIAAYRASARRILECASEVLQRLEKMECARGTLPEGPGLN